MAASWASSNDILMGALFSSPKSINADLMQNCDLPPPLKVFSGSDKTVLSSMNRVFSMMGREPYNNNSYEYGDEGEGGGGGDEKVGVLKALRLSQTRAREAEKKAVELTKERDCVSKALLSESLQVLGYKHCVMVLEVEVMKLKQQWQQQEMVREEKERCEDGSSGGASSWIVALALCFGIAGVGIAFGYKYLF